MPETALVIDARGKACPIPVIELARGIVGVAVGDEVVVLSDDPGARADIPAWSRMKAQAFLGEEPAAGGGWSFRVRRQA